MGYTHYFNKTRDATPAEWAEIVKAVAAIIRDTDTPLAGADGTGNPKITSEAIVLNGRSPNEFETFALSRVGGGEDWFCKTSRKPYDTVVTAILTVVDNFAPGAWTITSDGDPEEWVGGHALAVESLSGIWKGWPLKPVF